MTTHSLDLTRGDLIASLGQAAADDGRQRLLASIERYDNDDALARHYALAACAAGRPAYWTTAGYHAQTACALQLAANTMPTLAAALDACMSGAEPVAQRAALATLVPLNAAAERALLELRANGDAVFAPPGVHLGRCGTCSSRSRTANHSSA